MSISREITRLLGGEIHVESSLGSGSRFTLFLPLTERVVDSPADSNGRSGAPVATPRNGASPAALDVTDDSLVLERDDRVVLVLDSDELRAGLLLDAAHRHGAKGIIARRPSAGVSLAREHRPESILLAGDPARVESVLGQLKKHPETRHVPVVVISEASARIDALRSGAAAFLSEPVNDVSLREVLARTDERAGRLRRIAVVDENERPDAQIMELLSGDDVEVQRLPVQAATAALQAGGFDLAVVVAGRQRRQTLALLRQVPTDETLRELPIVVHTSRKLPAADRARVDALAKAAVICVAESPERLVDRCALFLHRVEAQLPRETRMMLGDLRTGDAPLEGKKVLVIDDDIRNVFALTSTLEQRGMKVVFAENGREGVERLHQHPNTDLVLLDIMMPEMDGYETAQAIRSMPRFEHLPIISLTAKAMRGDREKAIAAGASDYITKPVDIDHLVSMMRVWLDA